MCGFTFYIATRYSYLRTKNEVLALPRSSCRRMMFSLWHADLAEDRMIPVRLARLTRLIEAHGDELADGLLNKFRTSPRTSDLRNVPAHELRERSREIVRHLSEWLICKSDSDIERRYKEMGRVRASQAVSFADFCWALVFTSAKAAPALIESRRR